MCVDVFIGFINGTIVTRAAIRQTRSLDDVNKATGCDIKEKVITILCAHVTNGLYLRQQRQWILYKTVSFLKISTLICGGTTEWIKDG